MDEYRHHVSGFAPLVVLVAAPRTEQETASAREVIEAAVGEVKDVSTVSS